MKRLLLILFVAATLGACTSSSDEENGIQQLKNMGYTDIKVTGYTMFCCSDEDTFKSGFTAKDKNGNKVEGCFCSGYFKGVTIRFE